MISWLAYTVVVLCGVAIIWGLITAAADKPPGKAQLLFAAFLELVVIVQTVIAGAALALGFRPAELATTIGYLIGIVILIPVAWFWANSERTRFSGIVLAVRRPCCPRHDAAAAHAVDTAGTAMSHPQPRPTNTGPGRILVAVYGVFALAACSRATVQLATKFSEAPLAYLLSAIAGVIYVVATVTLARGTRTSRRVASAAIIIEAVGVLAVGTASLVDPAAFPSATVWSTYGIGYGFVPLVLPFLGLAWLYRTRPRAYAR